MASTIAFPADSPHPHLRQSSVPAVKLATPSPPQEYAFSALMDAHTAHTQPSANAQHTTLPVTPHAHKAQYL
jgi:hypothetical protein